MHNIDPMQLLEDISAIASDGDAATEVPKDAASPKPPPSGDPPEPAPLAPAKTSAKKRGAPSDQTPVMVPRAVYPTEVCGENGGEGWSATAAPHKRGTSKVSFSHARDATGAPFADVYLKSSCLLPLPEATPREAPKDRKPSPTQARPATAKGGKGKRGAAPKRSA